MIEHLNDLFRTKNDLEATADEFVSVDYIDDSINVMIDADGFRTFIFRLNIGGFHDLL